MGNSYFLFSIFASFVFIFIVGLFVLWGYIVLKSHGVFIHDLGQSPLRILLYLLPPIFTAGIVFPVTGILFFYINDIATVIMYKEKTGILRALSVLRKLFCAHTAQMLIYLLVRLGLYIGVLVISSALALAALIGLIVPAGMSVAGAAALLAFVPKAVAPVCGVIVAVAGIAGGLLIWCALMFLQLPFSVFLRTLSLKFVAAAAPEYNVFLLSSEGPEHRQPAHSPGLAMLMSFFIPGLGQAYNGEYAKCAAVFFSAVLVIPWIMGIIDAYQAGNSILRGERVHTARYGVLAGCACAMLTLLVFGVLILIAVIVALIKS